MINDSLRQRFLCALLVCVLGLAAPGYGQSLEPRGLLVREGFANYAVSPDGRMIAFLGVVDHGFYPFKEGVVGDLFVYDIRSKKVSRITRDWAFIQDLAWSYDSRFLAFTGAGNKAIGVWVVKPFAHARPVWSGEEAINIGLNSGMDTYPGCWWTAMDGVVAFPAPYDTKDSPYRKDRWLLWNVRNNTIVAAMHPAWEESAVVAVDRVHRQVFVLVQSLTQPPSINEYAIWSGTQHKFQFEHWTRLASMQVGPMALEGASGQRIPFSMKTRRIAFQCGSTGSNPGLCILDLVKNRKIKTRYFYPLEWSSNGVLLACVLQKRIKLPRDSPRVYNGDVYIIRYDGRIVKKFPGAFWAHWVGASNQLVLWRHGKLDIVKVY